MNFLILCQKYSTDIKQSWLTDSLALELAKTHAVSVVFLDWTGQVEADKHENVGGVDVYIYSTRNALSKSRIGGLLKWFVFPQLIVRKVIRDLAGKKFDLVINFSPALIMNPVLKAFRKQGAPSLLVLWDFFPLYDSEFNLIPAPVKALLKRVENQAYNQCDHIGAMSPKNMEFLRANYQVQAHSAVQVLSIWGPNDVLPRSMQSYRTTRAALGIDDKLVCVFGGQLVRGRGINKVFELARFAKNQGMPAVFYIFGDGPERASILLEIDQLDLRDVVVCMGLKPRDEYLRFLEGADVGLVLNSGGASVPTFPSKSIDYLRAGVPVLAYVEDASDFGDFLETKMRAGWSAGPAAQEKLTGDFRKMADMDAADRLGLGANGQRYYLEHMTVEKVSRQIVGICAVKP